MTANLSSMTPSQVDQATRGEDPEVWLNRTDPELDTLMLRLSGHWSHANKPLHSALLGWTVGAILTALAMAAVGVMPRATFMAPGFGYEWAAWAGVYVISTTTATAIVCGLTTLILEHMGAQSVRYALLRLQPISRAPWACARALELVRTSSAARDYRDQVLATGRQLRVIDCNAMDSLAAAQAAFQKSADQSAACRELHCLSVAA